MTAPPTPHEAALRWERLTPDRSLGAPVRPPGMGAVLGSRSVVALADPGLATLLFAAGPDGVPAPMGGVAASATGLCALADRLVWAGARARDGKHVVVEMDAGGRVLGEVELPIGGPPHRHPQPVCSASGAVRVVWEERGPGAASTLVWADVSGGAAGPAGRHVWPDRTVGFAPAAVGEGVWLLRDAGHPPRSQLFRLAGAGPELVASLPAPAVGAPARSGDGAAVLLVPSPQVLELGLVDSAGRLAPERTTVLTVPAPSTIDGALLVAAGPDVWAVAVASSGPDSAMGTLEGDAARRRDFTLVACEPRARKAGPPQPIGPPLAAAWLAGRLVLWTGVTGAAVSTWQLR